MKLVVDVRWDEEASVWYALSRGKTGLATEADSLDGLRERVLLLLPDLFDADGIEVELVVHASFKATVAAE